MRPAVLIAFLLLSASPVPGFQGGQGAASPKEPERKFVPISIEDALARGKPAPLTRPVNDLNERLKSMSPPSRPLLAAALGPGDVIEVTVIGVPGLDHREFVLDGNGMISLPYVNEVVLSGLTTRGAEVRIAELFGENLVEDPQVNVAVKDRRSQFIYVMGAVQRPGAHQINRETYLIDALSMAGGLSEKAGTQVQVHRASLQAAGSVPTAPGTLNPDGASDAAPPPQEETLEIDLGDLLEKGDISKNVPIFNRDMITVKERQDKYFYVLGDVPKAGAYVLRAGETMTLSKALALAGGVLKSAAGGKTSIIRQTPGQELPTSIPVDAIAVMKGRVPDVEVLENDVVLVPGSMSKTIGRGFMSSITGLLSTILVIATR